MANASGCSGGERCSQSKFQQAKEEVGDKNKPEEGVGDKKH
jgi:hypothetical protein